MHGTHGYDLCKCECKAVLHTVAQAAIDMARKGIRSPPGLPCRALFIFLAHTLILFHSSKPHHSHHLASSYRLTSPSASLHHSPRFSAKNIPPLSRECMSLPSSLKDWAYFVFCMVELTLPLSFFFLSTHVFLVIRVAYPSKNEQRWLPCPANTSTATSTPTTAATHTTNIFTYPRAANLASASTTTTATTTRVSTGRRCPG